MNETRRTLVQGAVCGVFTGVGLGFVILWHIVTSAPNAGAMVDGQFQPYQGDSSWHLVLAGGFILVVGGLSALAVGWRKLAG